MADLSTLYPLLQESKFPSVFECAIVTSLARGWKPAFDYILNSVIIPTVPTFASWGHRRHELFALAMLWLETRSLRQSGATLAESLFGMRRQQIGSPGPVLSQEAVLSSVACSVAVPYVRAKLDEAYRSIRNGGDGEGGGEVVEVEPEVPARAPPPPRQGALRRLVSLLSKVTKLLLKPLVWARSGVARIYPLIHMALEAAELVFQVRFALGASKFASMWYWVAGVVLHRATASELEIIREGASTGGAAWGSSLASKPVIRWFVSAVKIVHSIMTSHGFWIAILVFKLAEWWYSDDQQSAVVGPGVALPPPTAPTLKGRIRLPAEPGVCPLCRSKIRNPGAAASGIVYCYTCIHKALSTSPICPVTGMPTAVDRIRKLYEPR